MAISFLIADDHSIVRSGIKALVRNHFETDKIDEASNERDITAKIRSGSYQIVLLDINMPGSDFVSMMDWLKNTVPDLSILIFTTYPEEIYAKQCLKLGARGYLNKTAPNEEIILAIRKVLDGGIYLSNEIKQSLPLTEEKKDTVNPFDKLSARELEVALLVNKGHSLPDICSLLNIQYSTANTFKRRVFEKLGVQNAVSLSHLMKTFKIE
ncbi:MAG TPA: response regulator transcription factor [Puia sp.]|nr:response regulator transcription factor [Puia sp.]